jgi:hypothetical protein
MPQPKRRKAPKRPVSESPVAVFRGETFVGETIRIDARRFENCVFDSCILQFGAVEPATLIHNEFRNCQWEFVGPAAATLEFMTGLYHGGAQEMVEQTFENIRRGSVSHEGPPG